MKRVFNFTKFLFPALLIGVITTVTSCDNDDENIPVFSVRDADGTYSGKAFITQITPSQARKAESNPSVDISAEVQKDTVYFAQFPVDDVIISIVGADQAPAIIEAIGDVSYKVGYKATLSAKQDSIYLELDPKPLELILPGEGEVLTKVKVTVSAGPQGSFAYNEQQLKFAIRADKIELNEVELPGFIPASFNFNLQKK